MEEEEEEERQPERKRQKEDNAIETRQQDQKSAVMEEEREEKKKDEETKREMEKKNETEEKKERETEGDSHAASVRSHYNNMEEKGLQYRTESRVYHLKNLNNWIKSVLINMFLRRGSRVLDLCCGKGGDLKKWQYGNAKSLVGADIADVSISQAEERYRKSRLRFPAKFYAVDLFNSDLTSAMEKDPPPFDVSEFDFVSCQFALHYSFESEAKARKLLQNASVRLRDGGYFVGTVPSETWLSHRRHSKEYGVSFGNSVYQVTFDDADIESETKKVDAPEFGCRYTFSLVDSVDHCAEFVVPLATLERLAAEYGLTRAYSRSFEDFFEEQRRSAENRRLLDVMKVFDAEGHLSKEEWEVAAMYMVFAFRKQQTKPPA